MTHFRTSVNGLLAVIAGSCLALGAFRFHPSLGAFVLGLLCISWVRLRQLGKAQAPSVVGTCARAKIITIVSTFGIASMILLASSVPAVFLYALLKVERTSHPTIVLGPSDFLIIPLSALVGIPASLLLRKAFGWRK
jgi:hypothetical protein